MGSYHRNSLPQQHSDRRTTNLQNIDRFIPNRSAMDFDYAHYMLTEEGRRKQKENPSPARVAYRKLLAEALNLNRTRILAFKNNPSTPIRSLVDPGLLTHSSLPKPATTKPPRHIPQKSEMTMDAPDILDDFYLNLLDWGVRPLLLEPQCTSGMPQMALPPNLSPLTTKMGPLQVSVGLLMASTLLSA